MAPALLYRPQPPWRILTALIAAVLLHLGALAIAANLTTSVPTFPQVQSGGEIDLTSTTEPPANLEPSEELPIPTLPNAESSEFLETPVAQLPRVAHPRAPIARVLPIAARSARSTSGGITSLAAAKISAISAPRLEYPYEARRQHLTGSGVALLSVDAVSGEVTNVTVARSTGSAVLDHAIISGFRRWRFKPGTAVKVQTPVTYTLTGANY